MLKLRDGLYVQAWSVWYVGTSGNTVVVRYDRETAVIEAGSNDAAVEMAAGFAKQVETEQAHLGKARDDRQ